MLSTKHDLLLLRMTKECWKITTLHASFSAVAPHMHFPRPQGQGNAAVLFSIREGLGQNGGHGEFTLP